MITFLGNAREHLRESYWFIPGCMGLGAVLLAIASLAAEGEVSSSWLASSGWIYTRDPTGARQLLSTIGGSLITVTGVVFSVTLVALTNASAQFGTRILRTFARDSGNKVVLGAFVGTFLYCLLIMRTITGGPNGFVPHLSVLVAIALAMLCFALLIYFIHHVIRIVQADTVITALSNELNGTILRMFPSGLGDRGTPKPSSDTPSLSEFATPVLTGTAGYVQSIDNDAILKYGSENNIVVEIICSPGSFVFCGSTLALMTPSAGPEAVHSVAGAFNVGSERSYVQDVEFAFQQLVLVATRSLSPAINDQLLAMTCIDRLCETLVVLGRRELPSRFRADDKGTIRVIAPQIQYADIVGMAFSLVAEVSRDSAAVTSHLLCRIGYVLQNIQVSELRAALQSFASVLYSRSMQTLSSDADLGTVTRAYNTALRRRISKLA
jgi:uncharacterized membrane protein